MAGDAVFGSAINALTQLQADLNSGNVVQQATIGQISTALSTLTQALDLGIIDRTTIIAPVGCAVFIPGSK